ncbi:transcription factor Thi1 [Schizosaccharomyces japonicus yFS275]|uniref:Transcription factor Thi1 n=1 Tax=Schizosaccharomyces japonicus (strain yFS275 / FY16936) TaxID=402676 RepID=B6K4H7_SCHJY|nr:transcription factor Thi1 [Schizosaccharomyces japonicus yFS275]EEB08384.1 transcription factor Thi1 [Schizosaccharomyces japonicus yFS275]
MDEDLSFMGITLHLDEKATERKKKRRVPSDQRRRVFRACKHCRLKKIRCDGQQPCSACRMSDCSSQCVYVQKSHRELPSKEYLEELSERQLCLEYIITCLCPGFNLETKNLVALSKQLSQKKKYSNSVAPEQNDGSGGEIEKLKLGLRDSQDFAKTSSNISSPGTHVLEAQDQTVVGRLEESLYLGKSTIESYLDSVQAQLGLDTFSSALKYPQETDLLAVPNETEQQLLMHARSLIPSKVVVDFLVDSFFTHVQTHLFLYHASYFKVRLKVFMSMESNNDSGFLCILLLVLALGNQYAAERQGDVPSSTNQMINIGNKLFQTALCIFPLVLQQSNVSTVQSAVLIGFYLQPTLHQKSCYTYFGLAIKCAISMGLHKNCSDQGLSTSSQELRNRLWWSVYSIDRFIAVTTGRPCSIPDSEISVPYPQMLAELEVPGKPTMIPKMHAMIDIAKLCKQIQECIYNQNHASFSNQLDAIRKCFTSLELWKRNQKVLTSFDESYYEQPNFRESAQLQMVYENAVLLTVRPLTLYKIKGVELSPECMQYVDLCKKSAMNIVRLAHILMGKDCLSSYSFLDYHLPFASGVVLLLFRSLEPNDSMNDALSSLWDVLEFLAKRNETSRSNLKVLKTLEEQLKLTVTYQEKNMADAIFNGYQNWQSWLGSLDDANLYSPISMQPQWQGDLLPNSVTMPDTIAPTLVDESTASSYFKPEIPNVQQPQPPMPLEVAPSLSLPVTVEPQYQMPPFMSWTELVQGIQENSPANSSN